MLETNMSVTLYLLCLSSPSNNKCASCTWIPGFGVLMMFLSLIVIIQQHFHKRRAIAIAGAFAMSGASIGALAAGSEVL